MQIGEGVAGGGGPPGGGGSRGTTPTVLEIGFFFDGTLNHRGHAGSGGSGSRGNAVSNVGLLFPRYATETAEVRGRRVVRASSYLPGIGTSDGPDDMVDASFGTGNHGVSSRVHEACETLLRMASRRAYDEIIVDAFGFSRGAAAARYFVNCVNRRSFQPVQTGEITDEEPTRLARVDLPAVTVRFLGVFDTVAAIGNSRNQSVSDADNLDVNVHVKDGSARAIYHLVADNEYRENFALNSIRGSNGAAPSGAVEFVMPGAHSDVGGGYAGEGEGETVIPVQPALDNHATRAAAEAARTTQRDSITEFAERMHRESFAGRAVAEFSFRNDAITRSDIGDGRPYFYGGFWVWARSIRTGLEKVALRLMHDRALANEVPLSAIPDDAAHAVPSDLRHVVDILRGGGSLGRADLALLRMNYVHWSAHYGSAPGTDRAALDHSGFDAGIYVNQPAPNFRRIVHPNRPGSAW